MNARDRRLLASGINPATGAALVAAVLTPAGPPRLSRPANATAIAAPPWGQAAAKVPVPATADEVLAATEVPAARTWYDTGERGVSGSGRPTVVLLSAMKNGGFFRCTFPADAVEAIAHGKVLGADLKPVAF